MATPLTPQERTDIETAIRNGEPRNAIARRFNRSTGTITNVAKAAGILTAFDRAPTKAATQARSADMAAARAELAELFVLEAKRLMLELREPAVEKKTHVVSMGAGAGSRVETVEVTYPEPVFADKQRLVTAAAIAADKHLVLEKADRNDGGEAASLIEQLFDGLAP